MDDLLDLGSADDVLEQVNYRTTENAQRRRASLKSALRKHPVPVVVGALERKKSAVTGYKNDRIKRDITWTQNQRRSVL